MRSLTCLCAHSDLGGGETFLVNFLNALSPYFNICCVGQPEPSLVKTFLGCEVLWDNLEHNYLDSSKSRVEGIKPDVFINYVYKHIHYPIGKDLNVALVLFPIKELKPMLKGYDKVITISEYSAKYIREWWDIDPEIIHPAIEVPRVYQTMDKLNAVWNISRFFMEKDGHSKNQHFLIDRLKESLPQDWKAFFVGWCGDQDQQYFEVCQGRMDDRMKAIVNTPYSDAQEYLKASKVYIHANGYGRENPAQAEHFGYIFLEALRAGCVIVSHNSGNTTLSDFTYHDKTDFGTALEQAIHAWPTNRHVPINYTLNFFNERVRRAFEL